MYIQINKDIDTAYKNEAWHGFTLREVIYIVSALGAIAVTAAAAYFLAGMGFNTGIYVGMIPAAPILLVGFYRPHGMYCMEYLKELLFEKRTHILSYDTMQAPDYDLPFSMEGNRIFCCDSGGNASRKKPKNMQGRGTARKKKGGGLQ